ncbi:hypothetical protein MLD38_017333 [Melastoma candidum]|uniref:Uncharacterized protein n=1 Tax=Melastoma candidum TaxID=119954 RepID=A0ACB9QQ73_9MYRT|nr:hypothetical protein MLD38_017333 [Melastoma candidum]
MDIPKQFISSPSPALVSLALVATILFILKKWLPSCRLPPSPLALPIIGHFHLLGPLIHQSFNNLSSRYGPIFFLRLGSVKCIVVSSPEVARDLLKSHELTFSSRKHTAAIECLTYNSAFAFAPYGLYWKFIKRLSQTELLGPRTLEKFRPIRMDELRHFIRMLHDKSSSKEVVNVTQELLKLTNNVISRMMLSIRSSGSDGQAEEARNLIREVTQLFGEFNISDFIWFLKNIDFQGFRRRFEDVHARYDSLLERIISDREQSRKNKKENLSRSSSSDDYDLKDFLDMMLDVVEDDFSEMKLTRNHIKALVLDYFTAGTDTTAIAIEWALAELVNHPKLLEEARLEIDRVVGQKRMVGEADIESLPYIQAVVKETFRLHPPIPMVARKSIEDCTINGYKIPKDTLLFVNTWSMARNPTIWENPLEFNPGRFLHSGQEIDVKGQNFELLPFGTGRRGCPGISLAMKELHVTLAAMIQCFDWKMCGPDGAEVEAVDMTERPGLTAPRAHDMFSLPTSRLHSDNVLA